MKLATLQDGSRDGALVVVSRDLSSAHYATGIAAHLQHLLDDWGFISPQLQDLYETLNHGKARHAFPFDPRQCLAPLPRAYQRIDGCAYSHLLELLRQTGLSDAPAHEPGAPRLAQARSDHLQGACDDALFAQEDLDIDFGAQIAVITGEVDLGSTPAQALEGVRLLMLANDWRLHQRAPGHSPLHSQAATAFAPVAVTPDEVGEAWRGGTLNLAIQSQWNGRTVGMCDAGSDMSYHFGQLIAHACKTRSLSAASIITSGIVSNRAVEKKGKQEWPKGYHCIAEKRATETLLNGQPSTAYMKFGDTIRMEVKGKDGQSVFGAIEQRVVKLQ